MYSNLFSIVNKLKSYNVLIGDVELIKDLIISIDLTFKNDTPEVKGVLLIQDVYDLNQIVDWSSIFITISYMDMFNKLMKKKFKVIEVNEIKNGIYNKNLSITLQDTFSYTLDHSFLTRGFNDTPANALNEYISQLNLTDYDIDFTDINDVRQFIVPKNKSNLRFFNDEFLKYGYNFYQTRDKIYLKSQEDLLPSVLSSQDNIFTDNTDNEYYKNRILYIRVNSNNRSQLQPKTRTVAFDPDTKTMVYFDNNSNSNLILNDDPTNLQDTQGYRDVYQQHLNEGEHNRKLRDSLLKQGQVEIIVNGYNKNEVNQIYDLQLKGNSGSADTQAKGNMIISGKYVSVKVMDKIIGDTLIQKINLERADAQKKV